MRQQNAELVRRLTEAGVEYVLVGDLAAAAYGSQYTSGKPEIFAPFTVENLSRLLTALRESRLRDATRPDHPEIAGDPVQLARRRNLRLLTDLGRLDVFSEQPPLRSYAEAAAAAHHIHVCGVTCKVIDLDALIAIRESLGLAQDQFVVAELQQIRDRRSEQPCP